MCTGWYDVVVLPAHEFKWTFKEGEVAILSFPRPGSGSSTVSLFMYTLQFFTPKELFCKLHSCIHFFVI